MLNSMPNRNGMSYSDAGRKSIAVQRAKLGDAEFSERLRAIGKLGGKAGKRRWRQSAASIRARILRDGSARPQDECLRWLDAALPRWLVTLAGMLDRAGSDRERLAVIRLMLSIHRRLSRLR